MNILFLSMMGIILASFEMVKINVIPKISYGYLIHWAKLYCVWSTRSKNKSKPDKDSCFPHFD